MANVSHESGAEVLGGSLPLKDVNAQAHASREVAADAELLNGLALRPITPSLHSPTASTASPGKRKRQEAKAPQGSPGKRSRAVDAALQMSNTTRASGLRATVGNTLRRIIKPGPIKGKPEQISQASEEDIFEVPGLSHPKAYTGFGVPSSTARVSRPTRNLSKRKHVKSQEVEKKSHQEKSVARPSQSDVSTASSGMVEENNQDAVPPRLAISKHRPQPMANAQAQTNSDTELEPASSTSALRSRGTNVTPQRAESSEVTNMKLLCSPNGGKGNEKSAKQTVGDTDDVATDWRVDEHPDGIANSDEDYDSCDENHELTSNKIMQEHEDDDVVNLFSQYPMGGLIGPVKVELFGHDDSWATVLVGVREIGMSQVKGILEKNKPRLETSTIRSMVTSIKRVRSIYKKLLPFQGIDHDGGDILHRQLIERLSNIREDIREVSEEAAGTKASEVIQDIYAHAIPNLVECLQVALQCRSKEYSNPHDTDALQEIIALQDDILTLCNKAREWKAKPLSNRPIIKSTSQKILPSLRGVTKAFRQELEERKRLVDLKKQKQRTSEIRKICAERDRQRKSEKLRLMEESRKTEEENNRRQEEEKARSMEKSNNQLAGLRRKRDEKDRWAKEEKARLMEESRRLIEEDLRQDKARRGRNTQSSNVQFGVETPHFRPPPTINAWTTEQDRELLQRLQWKALRNLPGLYQPISDQHALIQCLADERYLRILNAPSLQNKLPEHIRERALYYKAAMLAQEGPRSWVMSIL